MGRRRFWEFQTQGSERPGCRGGGAALACAALLLLSLASAAGPREGAAVRLEGGSALSSGQVVRVTWDPLPPDTEEFELLLRCDLPLPVTLRLTESRDPASRDYLWRVPNAPCLSARLLLRRGGEEGEVLWAESAPFRILLPRGEPVSEAAYLRGELWLSPLPPRPSAGLREGAPALLPLPGRPPSAELVLPSKALAAPERGEPWRPGRRERPNRRPADSAAAGPRPEVQLRI